MWLEQQFAVIAAGNKSCPPGPGQQVLLSFQDLELHRQDHANHLWVAEANQLTTVTIVTRPAGANTTAAIKQLEAWLDTSEALMQQCQNRVSVLGT